MDVLFGAQKRTRSNSQPSDLQRKRRKLLQGLNSWQPVQCCKKNCSEKVGIEKCRALREEFLESTRDNRKALLGTLVRDSSLAIDGVKVCWRMVIGAFGVSRSMISNVLQLPSANASHLPGRMGGTDGSQTMKSGVLSFLRLLADEVADELPNSIERHLPHGSKQLVFLLYQDNERKCLGRHCQQSHFYTIWKTFCPHIKCRRAHGFTVCDTCTQFKEKLQNLARRPGHHNERNFLRRGFGKHVHHVYSERGEYRIAQTMAIERPKEFLSVIIDGADQAKFALPRFATKTKRETEQAMKQKVTVVLFHGGLIREDFLSFFTSADNMPSGANQTIDTFCRALFVLVEKREAQGLRQFPADLFIQLDNTAKDNKNRFFLAFCELMIRIGLFSRVAVNFLPVGHTHEDIDRNFSRVSVFLRNRTTATISDIHEALKQSQSCKVPRIYRGLKA